MGVATAATSFVTTSGVTSAGATGAGVAVIAAFLAAGLADFVAGAGDLVDLVFLIALI